MGAEISENETGTLIVKIGIRPVPKISGNCMFRYRFLFG
jgi:hypothetical protein